MTTIKFHTLIFATFALIGAGGCNLYPDDETRVEDLDMVFTYYDNQADFKSLNTYSIVDEVYEMNGDTTGSPDVVNNSDYILDVINQNMEALGYQKVDDSANPDVKLTVTATSTTFVYYYYSYYYYYYYYWWGYYPGGGWYYPGYGYPVVETYSTGTLFIDMVDFRNNNGSSSDSLKVMWNGALNGLLETGSTSLKARVKEGIDQAFEQSPYLATE